MNWWMNKVYFVKCWHTQSVLTTKLKNSALSKRSHSVWLTRWNMLWSFYVSKSILDTLSVQCSLMKTAMELILINTILQLWGWLSRSRTPSLGIHTAENVKVVEVTPIAIRYVIDPKGGSSLLQNVRITSHFHALKIPQNIKNTIVKFLPRRCLHVRGRVKWKSIRRTHRILLNGYLIERTKSAAI